MSSRPRRSTAAPTDYSQFLNPIQLSSSGEDEDDSSGSGSERASSRGAGGSGSGSGADGKGKGRAVDQDNGGGGADGEGEKSGSKGKGKGKAKAKAEKKKRPRKRALYIPSASSGSSFAGSGSSSSSAGPSSDDGGVSSADDAPSDAGEAALSDSGSIVSGGGGGGTMYQRRAGLSGRGGGGGRGRGRGRGGAKAAQQREVVYSAAATGGARPGKALPPRAAPPAGWPQSGWDHQYSSAGPLASLTPSLTLHGGKGKRLAADPVASTAKGLSDKEASRMMEHWTSRPFLGPGRGSARDLGYYPGRWVEGEKEGEWTEKETWAAAALPEGAETAWEEVSEAALFRSLPRPLPTLHQPLERYSISAPLPGSGSGSNAPAASQAASDAAGTPAPGELEGEGEPGASGSGSGPGTAAAAEEAEGAGAARKASEGAVTLLLGGIVAAGEEEEPDEQRVTLERFGSLRMDTYLPSKPAHLLNAGGPVNALAWMPRPRCAPPGVQKEYLALSTLSTLDTPLAHNPPASSSSSAGLAGSPAFHGHLSSSSSAGTTDGQQAVAADAIDGLQLPTPPLPGGMIQLWSFSLGSKGAEAELAPETAPLPAGEEGEDEAMDGTGEGAKQERGMKFEMGLCIPEGAEGDCWDLQWMPAGGSGSASSPAAAEEDAMDVDADADEGKEKEREKEGAGNGRLGILAGVFRDGTISLFEVPKPEAVRQTLGKGEGEEVFVTARPLLKLRLPNTSLFSLAWGSSRTIAGGCSNGWIAVWNIGGVLDKGWKQGDPPPRPIAYYPAHSSVIRSLCFVLSPPPSLSSPTDGAKHDLDAEPTGIVSTGYDGSTVLSDLRNTAGGVCVMNHERTPAYSVAFSPHTGCAYVADQDDRLKSLFLRPSEIGSNKRIAAHRGAVMSIATSPHHPFVLSASVDGSALLATGMRALRKRRVKGHFLQKLFKLEVNRESGEVRVWDNLEMEYRQALDPTNAYALKSKKKTVDSTLDEEELHTPAWPIEQAVLKAAWHPALERAGLCATGWACGIARVEWCEEGEV
ncbi:hypothetical protein JCM10213_007615 [Rhodosporidiobolus nylandii]